MKRHSFILAEALIGSILMVLAVTFCFSMFFFFQKATTQHAKTLELLQQRTQSVASLRRILQQIQDAPHARSAKKYPFYLEYTNGHQSPRLVFAFHNEIDLRPQHCNDNFGMLYIDSKAGLVLVMRSREAQPSKESPSEVAHVIWPNAEQIKWRFLVNKAPPYVNEPHGGIWLEEWKPEWGGIPYAIEATITEKNQQTCTVTSIVIKAMNAIVVPP